MIADDDEFIERLADAEEALACGQDCSDDQADPRLKKGIAALQALRKIKPANQVLQPTPRFNAGDTISNTKPAPVPRKLGRFEVLRELGRGGFGVVFLARDGRLNRDVALKVPHIAGILDDSLRERFQREATTAACLRHPNIVSVFETDHAGPICWIAYEYCPGITLSEWMGNQRDPIDAQLAAELVANLADAIQHAHEQGVLHRDLKPANVLIASGASLKITDFGLAKLRDQVGDVTRTGAVIGTPAYMAPEQAQGKLGGADERADIYALGVILYELLVGRAPFRGETDVETLQLVQNTEPVRPRQLRPKLPRDLETICLKCLEKEPARRYSSSGALRDDLQRFLNGQPVVARPVGAVGRAGRWCRRQPVISALAMALVATIALGITGMVHQYRQTNQERDTAINANEKNKTLVASLAKENERANLERDSALKANERTNRLLHSSSAALQEMIDLGHNLTHVPQTVDQGAAILRTAHQYYKKLIVEYPQNEEMHDKAGIICRRLALIYKEKKNFADCETMWVDALEHAQRRLAIAPKEPMRRYDVYFATSGLGYAKEMLGKIVEASTLRQESEEMIEALLAQYPDQPAYQDAVSRACFNKGELARQRRQFQESEPEFGRCVELDRKLLKSVREHERYMRLIASLNRMADSRTQLKRYDEAEENAKECLQVCKELAQRYPERPAKVQEAMAWFILRQVHGAKQQWAPALEANLETLKIITPLKDQQSSDGDFYHQLLRQTIRAVECFDKLGRGPEAIPYLQTAINAEVPDYRPKEPPPELLTCCTLLLRLQTPRDEKIVVKANDLLTLTAADPKCANAREKLSAALAGPPRTDNPK